MSFSRVRREHVFAGQYDRAELPPPTHDDDVGAGIASAMFARTLRPETSDPLHHLVRDHVRCVDRAIRGTGCECTDGRTVWFGWTSNQRELGRRGKHGHAHCLWIRSGLDHSETDAILLTGELALPRCLLRVAASADDAIDAQPWAPGWLIRAAWRRRRQEVEHFSLVG